MFGTEQTIASKHCEFAAVSKQTDEKYWVEAKMRAVVGLLGRTAADGGADGQPLARLIPHLNDALAKPAADKRLIFIDVNTPTALTVGIGGICSDPSSYRLLRGFTNRKWRRYWAQPPDSCRHRRKLAATSNLATVALVF
jgi:hypothetical protein